MPLPRMRYQTVEFDSMDIHLRTLRDRNQFYDPDGEAEKLGISSAVWPIFGIVWPSSRVLAHLMEGFDIEGLRILEVGCGIGLASLVLNAQQADITATDYHPSAQAFLEHNVGLNGGAEIPFVRAGWADSEVPLGEFDLLIGSDVLYESEHVALLAEFVDQHAAEGAKIIIVDAGRGHAGRFSREMESIGYTCERTVPNQPSDMPETYKGKMLTFVRPDVEPQYS